MRQQFALPGEAFFRQRGIHLGLMQFGLRLPEVGRADRRQYLAGSHMIARLDTYGFDATGEWSEYPHGPLFVPDNASGKAVC